MTFVIAVSGVIARKGVEKLADYNNAAMLARWAAESAHRVLELSNRIDCDQPKPTLASVTAQVASQVGEPESSDLVRERVLSAISSVDNSTHSSGCFPGSLSRRYLQFHAESEVIVPQLCNALTSAQADMITNLADWSQNLATSHLRNTVEETEWLPATARKLGAIAASSFGAGFGGSVWALIPAEQATRFASKWEEAVSYTHLTLPTKA